MHEAPGYEEALDVEVKSVDISLLERGIWIMDSFSQKGLTSDPPSETLPQAPRGQRDGKPCFCPQGADCQVWRTGQGSKYNLEIRPEKTTIRKHEVSEL